MLVGRNTVESLNEDFKSKSGNVADPRMRRMLGLTALYFISTIALAHFNIQNEIDVSYEPPPPPMRT